MKYACLSVLIILTGITGVHLDTAPPSAQISNGLITANLYLPDATNGYYRGARFDWSGVIYDLRYKDHRYFDQWFEKYSPTLHDAIMGPVDSFDPIGYDEIAAGESFLRVGIGMLVKPDEPKYAFTTPYQISNGGKWTLRKKSDQIEFIHDLKDKKYGYKYSKIVRLEKDKPDLVLIHKLKNTGSATIEANVYNHNFFVMDRQPTGPDFIVKFPFQPEGEGKGKPGSGEIRDKALGYNAVLNKGENFMISPLTGFGATSADYDIHIENTKTGAGVRITGDQPIVRFVYWSATATLCPEPYTKVRVEPGKEITWTIKYNFYVK